MAHLHADGRIVTRVSGSPLLKRYLAEAEPPLGGEDPEGAASLSVPAYIREVAYILARKLALQPAALSDFEWRDLERALAAACEGLGFDTRLTRPGKDGGFDIELRCGEARYLIEVKHWSTPNRVGLGPVSHFAEIVLSEGADRGLFLSSSGFRKPFLGQRLEITPSRIALGDGRKIIGLCQSYVRREEGLWHPSTDLEELLFLETT